MYTYDRQNDKPARIVVMHYPAGDYYQAEASYDLGPTASTYIRLRRPDLDDLLADLDGELMRASDQLEWFGQEEKDAILDAARAALTDPAPVPLELETLVAYTGKLSPAHTRFRITSRRTPQPFPGWQDMYPDGVAYDLWPAELPRKMGNRHHRVLNVRRSHLTVLPDDPTAAQDNP